MAFQGDANVAMTNRSLRTIRTELEYLTDASIISPSQLQSILAMLPSQTQLHAPLLHAAHTPNSPAPISPMSSLSLNEKQQMAPYNPVPSPAPPPPAYGTQHPPVLSIASALYAYAPTDAGDLAIQPNDRISVLEHMNSDWWRGRNERTGLEGIFPRSYVSVIEEKGHLQPPQPTNYGNMPLEVAQGGSGSALEPSKHSKFEEQGKKFGKKMGNAAIFGAGATMGSKIVNGIF